MRTLRVVLMVALSSCATASPYAQIAKAKTIEEAQALLGETKPLITHYAPNVEAWYFGKNECVLFIDGKLRVSKSSYTDVDGTPVPPRKQKQVLCNPSEAE